MFSPKRKLINECALVIVKPLALKKGYAEAIQNILTNEETGLKVIDDKKITLTKKQAETFYAVHVGKHFYNDLINYMISGEILLLVLSGNDVIKTARHLIGATDPQKAAEGTIRNLYASGKTANAAHCSDSDVNALCEIKQFFNIREINQKISEQFDIKLPNKICITL